MKSPIDMTLLRDTMERARIVLKRRPKDEEAGRLLHEVNVVLSELRVLDTRPDIDGWRDRALRAIARGFAFHERMKAYCARERLHYVSYDSCPTIEMTDAQRRELIEQMPRESHAPPAELMADLLAAQQAANDVERVSLPPEATTDSELPKVEDDDEGGSL